MRRFWLVLCAMVLAPCLATAEPIDRRALVARHAITQSEIDPHAPLMIGNGELAFTADITGLQTFPERYSSLAPLLTMAQWAWHSFPNPNGYAEADGLTNIDVPGRGEQPYAWMRDWSELQTRPALVWLRENPHRFSLGRVGLVLRNAEGAPARFEDLSATRQELDLWTGALKSQFVFDGAPVSVETRMHPTRDMVLVEIRSPHITRGQVGLEVRYPGVSTRLNPDPSDWSNEAAHQSDIALRRGGDALIRRTIDSANYASRIMAPGARIEQTGPHRVRILANGRARIVAMISFERDVELAQRSANYASAVRASEARWRDYWTKGGVIDFSGSADPRAAELERRVVLSQYLEAINAAGSLPPQEEGLFSNSWNGKFHLEVHPLHAAHFAAWGRSEHLERSLAWYFEQLPRAQDEAKRHGVEGAWWPKMVGPEGRNSPSTINPFIMWQQPHPIYMAELVYRASPDARTLARYAEIVEQTANLLASWPMRGAEGDLDLGPPIIPVQENHSPLTTINPMFEVEYYRWALGVAQLWRERRGLTRSEKWDEAIANLAPPPSRNGLYLPVETAPDFWTNAISPTCSRNAIDQLCLNRDHPSFLMAYGYIAGPRTDPETMRNTLRAVEQHWDLRQTWGWDFPTIAITAARLGEPEKAIDWLFTDMRNNQWGVSGMTPRVHLDAHVEQLLANAADVGPDGPGYRRAAETYFPSNGSLLLAVGMMAAGWDGSEGQAPGFPKRGWRVRAENIQPLP